MRKFFAAGVMLLAAGSTIAAAQENESQKNEIAGTIGRTFISDQGLPNTNFFDNTVHFGKGLTLEANYARRLRRYSWGDFAVEVPLIYNPDEDLNFGMNQVPLQYSSIFITPAARVSFIPNLAVSPWFSFGGGFGHFGASSELVFGGINPGPRGKTTGVLEGGVGTDVRLPKLHKTRFRFEARDDWSGESPINVNTGKSRRTITTSAADWSFTSRILKDLGCNPAILGVGFAGICAEASSAQIPLLPPLYPNPVSSRRTFTGRAAGSGCFSL